MLVSPPPPKQVANRTWTRSPLRDAVAARACGCRALPPPVPRLHPHRPPPHSRAGHQLRRLKRQRQDRHPHRRCPLPRQMRVVRRVGRFDQPGEAEAAGRTPTLDARPAAPHPGRRLLRPLAASDDQHRRIAPPPPDAPCAGRRLGQCQAFALRALKRLHRLPYPTAAPRQSVSASMPPEGTRRSSSRRCVLPCAIALWDRRQSGRPSRSACGCPGRNSTSRGGP